MTTATVARLVRAQQAVEGDGFVVRRPFPTPSLSHLDPFLLFDHMGPGRIRARQGRRHAVAPPPRLRDRHLSARGRHGASRLDGQPRLAALGRHAMDDRRIGSTAQGRAQCRLAGHRRSGARPAAVGEPAARPRRWTRRRTRTCAPRPTPAATSPAPSSASSPASCSASPDRAARGTPISYAHVTLDHDATVTTPLPHGHTRAGVPDDRRRAHRRHPGRRRHPRRPRRRRRHHRRASPRAARSSCSPANPSASRSPATGPS